MLAIISEVKNTFECNRVDGCATRSGVVVGSLGPGPRPKPLVDGTGNSNGGSGNQNIGGVNWDSTPPKREELCEYIDHKFRLGVVEQWSKDNYSRYREARNDAQQEGWLRFFTKALRGEVNHMLGYTRQDLLSKTRTCQTFAYVKKCVASSMRQTFRRFDSRFVVRGMDPTQFSDHRQSLAYLNAEANEIIVHLALSLPYKEWKVWTLRAQRFTTNEIAASLGISARAVAYHLRKANVYLKRYGDLSIGRHHPKNKMNPPNDQESETAKRDESQRFMTQHSQIQFPTESNGSSI